MQLSIDRTDSRPLGMQIYEQVRSAIAEGRLQAGDAVAPSRTVASALGISRHTVTTAYGRLTAEGYLDGRRGGGSVVAQGAAARGLLRRRTSGLQAISRIAGLAARADAATAARPLRYDMRPGRPDPGLFPFDPWRRALASVGGAPIAAADGARGLEPLRAAVARWIARTRSIVADEETIVITAGVQHAIDAVCRALLEPGDVVAVEDPGFVHLRELFAVSGLRVAAVPVDAEGLVVDRLPDRARMVFVTPSHQYPLGMTMTLQRRQELLAWAARRRAAIVEDDFESEIRYVDHPLEPLQRLDRNGNVVYVGSFWKTLSPAVRVGFAVVPSSITAAVEAVVRASDSVPSPTVQLALARLIDGGELDRHLRRSTRMYRHRHDVLTAALREPSLAAHVELLPSHTGLHVTTRFTRPRDEARVVAQAASRGLAITGLSRLYMEGDVTPGLVMGFGAIEDDDLLPAIRILSRVLGGDLQSQPRSSAT